MQGIEFTISLLEQGVSISRPEASKSSLLLLLRRFVFAWFRIEASEKRERLVTKRKEPWEG